MKLPDFSFLGEYSGMTLDLIVVSMFVGIIIASVAIIYHKVILGNFVRALIGKKALSPESAVSLEEIGYKNNAFIRSALRTKSTFRKTVHCIDNEFESEGKRFNPCETRFYIPEKIILREEIKYSRKGTGLFSFFITILVFLAVGLVSLSVIPWFTQALNNIFK